MSILRGLRIAFFTTLFATLALMPSGCASTNVELPGIDDFDSAIDKAMRELLPKLRAQVGENMAKGTIAVFPIAAKGDLALGSNEGALYAKICKYITDTGIWTPISRDLVVAAMRAAAIADRRDLLIREGRDKFVSVLQDSSDRPEYIIAPELNTLSSRDNKGYIYERRIEVNLQAYTADGGRVAAEATGDALKSRPR